MEENEKLEELMRLATNNPAMTIPDAQVPRRTSTFKSRTSPPTRSASASAPVGDPAGDAVGQNSQQDPLTVQSKYDVGWRRVVRNFSPSWFSVTMGTGVVSLLLTNIPFEANWLYWLSVFFFGLNTILFALAFSISVLRYTLYPEIWSVMINDSTNSLFLGTIPMGFATLIQAWVVICCPYWGRWSINFAWGCWMIDAVVAAAITVSLPFLLMSQSHQQSLDRITAAQLLPIAATIVAANAGAKVAQPLIEHDPQRALGTLITAYVLWGMATPLAMTVLVMYYQRLCLHKLPPREVVVSSFLPLGPLGTGSYTIMYCGKVAREVFPKVGFFQNLSIAGDIAWILGIFIALIMWGFGLCWLVFAVATIWNARPFPFNMGWWGFTFPLGVYSISTMQFGKEMPSLFFKILGTILAVANILLWSVVATGTAQGAWKGHLFHAPCLRNLKRDEDIKDEKERPDSEEASSGHG